ncbi:hypothetical protein J2W42_006696 [Rhizobium tibeticum]|uniref:hypothetical protein n=1 Tax=Rhizobium tibeticum TaxID=501024 RepID=UPI002786342F|nr:hypothetical protein [Rhizobium tibeticum]MDP9813820.1 hypothetical protein [Rhizobium tibeticum]
MSGKAGILDTVQPENAQPQEVGYLRTVIQALSKISGCNGMYMPRLQATGT